VEVPAVGVLWGFGPGLAGLQTSHQSTVSELDEGQLEPGSLLCWYHLIAKATVSFQLSLKATQCFDEVWITNRGKRIWREHAGSVAVAAGANLA